MLKKLPETSTPLVHKITLGITWVYFLVSWILYVVYPHLLSSPKLGAGSSGLVLTNTMILVTVGLNVISARVNAYFKFVSFYILFITSVFVGSLALCITARRYAYLEAVIPLITVVQGIFAFSVPSTQLALFYRERKLRDYKRMSEDSLAHSEALSAGREHERYRTAVYVADMFAILSFMSLTAYVVSALRMSGMVQYYMSAVMLLISFVGLGAAHYNAMEYLYGGGCVVALLVVYLTATSVVYVDVTAIVGRGAAVLGVNFFGVLAYCIAITLYYKYRKFVNGSRAGKESRV